MENCFCRKQIKSSFTVSTDAVKRYILQTGFFIICIYSLQYLLILPVEHEYSSVEIAKSPLLLLQHDLKKQSVKDKEII